MADGKPTREDALAAVGAYIQKGRGAESTAKLYDDTADKYDQYMEALNFGGPTQLAKSVSALIGDRFDIKVIDIGAGSGLSGLTVYQAGYKNIDAVDASQGLLDSAKEKGVYGKLICQLVGDTPLPLEDNAYDVATICGAMGENHIPRSGLRDIIRIVKSGGYIVNVFREEAVRVAWYEEGLEPFMKQLEAEGVWKEESREYFPTFIGDVPGIVLIHKVL
ncbi:demethylmenaquinone methyltransferase [Aplysia californica]|uniref:Demethylmenaquinone methyltransferase n=1 Tax=Aplysia californica TaxID=6500 RepID=A0ABM1VW52_APLCA|nr:demethylmenaquinone methyltransferase [Aplysia californica]